MKNFFRKRWHGIPVGIIAVFVLVGIVAASAYTFLSFTTKIILDEPLRIEMKWYDNTTHVWTDWWELTGEEGADELDLYMSPGESQVFGLRAYNRSYGTLTLRILITGETDYFTFEDFPTGQFIPFSDGDDSTPEWSTEKATIRADGDAPPGTYSVNISFTRE